MVAVDEVSKNELRKFAKIKRLTLENKKQKEIIIINKLLNLDIIKESNNILIYMSTKEEVSTKKLINRLLKLNKKIFIPKVINKNLKFYKLDYNHLRVSIYNILEPTNREELKTFEKSVIIVPGLMFDKSGNRLGYGGGYYDRFLSDKTIYKIGICFKEFLVDSIPNCKFDIKMDIVITN